MDTRRVVLAPHTGRLANSCMQAYCKRQVLLRHVILFCSAVAAGVPTVATAATVPTAATEPTADGELSADMTGIVDACPADDGFKPVKTRSTRNRATMLPKNTRAGGRTLSQS